MTYYNKEETRSDRENIQKPACRILRNVENATAGNSGKLKGSNGVMQTDRKEALRYLGLGKHEPDPETEGVEGLLMGPDENVEILYRKEPYLTAPVEAGECVGEISYLVDGRVWRRERLTAAKDVEAIDFVWCGRQILWRFLVRSL